MNDAKKLAGHVALVTGAAGFIGSALCRGLTQAGMEVHGVSRTERVVTDSCARWHSNRLDDIEAVRALFKAARPDYVFHLASHVAGSRAIELVLPTFSANLTSTVNLLTAATELGCERILLTGSLEEPEPGPDHAVPSSPYAAAKFAASAYGRMFHALYNTPVAILRLFMVYGPGQQDLRKLVPYVTLSLLKGQTPELSSGVRKVDWIYVDDVVAGYLAAATAKGVEGEHDRSGERQTGHRADGSGGTGWADRFACPAVIRIDTRTGAGADPDGGCREKFPPAWLAHAGQLARWTRAHGGVVSGTASARRFGMKYPGGLSTATPFRDFLPCDFSRSRQ